MITFSICLALLVAAYFTYGRYLEQLCDTDDSHPVPSKSRYDGVDFLPLPRWKVFLIQLLNIAGLGPIFGAVLGAAYGPVAFLWITLGGIFVGGLHDMISGILSIRYGGESLPEIVGEVLGDKIKLLLRIVSVLLLVLVGTVFLSQPALLIAGKIDAPALETIAFGNFSWLLLIVLGVILAYYILATLLPVDKIIGRFYPLFGVALLLMAAGILAVLLLQPDRYPVPEQTSLRNLIDDARKFPIMPMLFTTIACGAVSGFHATQSPLMARCITSEKQSRAIFYGAMIVESIIALIWAAAAMSFWGGVKGLNAALAEFGGNAALPVDRIAAGTLGPVFAGLVIFGVIACAITSGDTAFRSARLIVADFTGINQKPLTNRIRISLPLFALGLVIFFGLPFNALWSYFAWTNQMLAMITLWTVTVYLSRRGKTVWPALLPALFMTYVCSSYLFVSPLMLGMENRTAAYLLGGVLTGTIAFYFHHSNRRHAKEPHA